MAFIDGNDLCAGCSNCCRNVQGLILTAEELERVPKMKPFVVDGDGSLFMVNMPDGCPYLLPNGWCGTFETRPFDCSLFPVQVGGVRREPGRNAIEATWRWGEAPECPSRSAFVARGVSPEQVRDLRKWIGAAYGSEDVALRQAPPPGGWRGRLRIVLRRARILPTARRSLG